MTLSKTGKAASEYANAYGIPVFPLWPKSKNPMTTHGFHDATTDQEQIAKWWASKPNANVAGAMGDGIICIDFDVDENGSYNALDWLSDWESENGKLPETATAITGRGGMHIFYRVDRDIKKSENCELHIDIRGSGSYAMLAPSVHPNGNTVYWDLDPDDYGIAEANDLVYKLVDDVRPKAKRGERAVIPADKLKAGEGRNNFLYKQGCSVRAKGADDKTVASVLLALNRSKCSPPLPDDELQKVIRSVCSIEPGLSEEAKETQKQAKRGRPQKFDHAAIAEKLISDNGACMIDGMPAIRHGKTYQIGWKAVDREIILLERGANRTNQREVQHYLSVMAENKRQSPANLIAFANGVLDVKTMELRDFRDDDVIPNVIPWDWKPEATCLEVDEVLLKMACGDSDTFEQLIEVMGVCMYRSSEFTQSAILLGDGSNGKSTYIRMLTALLGKDNVSTISMTQIGKQFLVGRLAGKLANLGSEISNEFKNGDLLSTFKELVDGNRMHADVKGVEGFDFESYATIVMCANEFPKLADSTDGMMRRIYPIEFNARFRKTDPDYNPRIAQIVTSREACERMAVLGVMGLQQVFKNNGFTPTSASDKRLEEIRAENDTALAWLDDVGFTADDLDGTPTAKHYEHYKDWCADYGYQAYGHKKFTKLVNKHRGLECRKIRVNSVPLNCFGKRNA